MVKFLKYWLPVAIYAILIFCLSSLPGEKVPQLFAFQDVVFHVIEYAVFALLINRALRAYWPKMLYHRRFFWVFCLVLVYAVSDEIHQSFTPQRFASFSDIIYDGIGVFISRIFYR